MFLPKQLPRLMHSRCPLPTSRNYGQERLQKLWDSMGSVLNLNPSIPEVSSPRSIPSREDLARLPATEPPKVPRRIQPWSFSAAELDWVQSGDHADQHGIEIGTTLPVVLWSLKYFGPQNLDAARTSAAMSLLGEIFGERPRPMAIMLNDVSPWVLHTILEHEWVRQNFQVGFDETPVQPCDLEFVYFPKYPLPKPFVMMVSSCLRTELWMLMEDVLSVDLPVGCQDGRQNEKGLLRLGMARLSFEREISKRRFARLKGLRGRINRERLRTDFEKFMESNGPKAQKNKLRDIQNYMRTGLRPGNRVIASVLGSEMMESEAGRNAYRWTKTGAAALPRETQERKGRLVQFRPWGVEGTELLELGTRFAKHGINGKVDLGGMPEGEWPEVAADRDWELPGTGDSHWAMALREPRHWSFKAREVSFGRFSNQALGWPRNRLQSNGASRFKRRLRQIDSDTSLTKEKAESKKRDLRKEFTEEDFNCPSFSPLFSNDRRFNYDFYKGHIYKWISDDFGIGLGFEVCKYDQLSMTLAD
ncbi:hypothetical protein IWZ00DRAFT_346189 [Phyllosticta capitalensis]